MPCSSCAQRWANQARFSRGRVVANNGVSRSVDVPDNYVKVTYLGPAGNHYILSPTKVVKHYGYGGRGTHISVHPDDVRKEPTIFVPISIVEAKKVWPNYPSGTPESIILALGLPVEGVLA